MFNEFKCSNGHDHTKYDDTPDNAARLVECERCGGYEPPSDMTEVFPQFSMGALMICLTCDAELSEPDDDGR